MASEKKTFNETKHEVAEGEINRIVSKADTTEYAIQAGFNQVQHGVHELFADFLEQEILATSVQSAVFNADANREKSLRIKHAQHAIATNPLIPAGHYK
jgi:hypothetical protein